MEKFLLSILDYLLQVLIASMVQLFVLFGPLLILAIIMHFVAKSFERQAYITFGRNGYLYTFGWLGTSVHEIGHAVFTIIFGHKITNIVLFDPSPYSDSLGHVAHSYKPGNIYQEIGNFFIGIGPILFGSIILYISTYILFKFSITEINTVDITSESLTSLSAISEMANGILNGLSNYLSLILYSNSSSWWKILILIYLLVSVGSSITLSGADISGAVEGFIFFVLLLLSFNLVTIWIGDFGVKTLSSVGAFFSGFYFLMCLAIVINLFFYLFLLSLNLIFKRF